MHIKVNVQIRGGTKTLYQRDRAGVNGVAFAAGLFCEMTGDGALHNLQHRREQLGLRGEQHAQRNRQRQHPLADRHIGQYLVH
jgi:hypothetical protein